MQVALYTEKIPILDMRFFKAWGEICFLLKEYPPSCDDDEEYDYYSAYLDDNEHDKNDFPNYEVQIDDIYFFRLVTFGGEVYCNLESKPYHTRGCNGGTVFIDGRVWSRYNHVDCGALRDAYFSVYRDYWNITKRLA